MGKLIRVNMSSLQVNEEQLPGKYAGLGGRGLTSRLVLDEVPPTCDPLGHHNKLVMAPGILGGTTLSSSGRLSIGAKSPLTGGIKESNAGGVNGQKLAKLGISALVIEGAAADGPYLLFLSAEGGRLVPAADLKGMGNYALIAELARRYGGRAGIISIGPAGEMCLAGAAIANTDRDGVPSRFNGRGGLGAVMGSKGLKAVVIGDSGASKEIIIKDKETFGRVAKELHGDLLSNPVIQGYTKYGTPGILTMLNELGALPTFNFREGSFDGANRIGGEAVYNLIQERGGEGNPSHACMNGCVIKCSNIFPGPDGKAIVSPLEFETLGLLGSNCGIADLDAIARLNWLCNDLGIDTIETGAALAVAMEAGAISFGDAKGAERLIKEIGEGSLLGRALGGGAVLTGRLLGVRRIPAVKGQAISAYDPRGVKGNGVTFVTSPMGADHTAGNLVRAKNQHLPEGQVALSLNAQILMAAYDNLGLCIFLGAAFNPKLDLVRRLVMAKEGAELPGDYITRLGKQVLRTEWEFNKRAGFTPSDNRLPEFMHEEQLSPLKTIFDVDYKEMDEALEALQSGLEYK